MRRLALSSFALSALLLAPAAGAQTVIDFAEYLTPVTWEYAATVGDPLSSKGLDFYETQFWNGNSSRNVLGTWGTDAGDPGSVNRPVNIGGSAAMFATTTAGLEIDIYAGGSDFALSPDVFGTPFHLYSMDVAHLYSTEFAPFTLGAINLTISGFGPGTGGATITQAFTIPVPPLVGGFRYPVLNTLTFDDRWRGLVNVWWYQSTGSGTAHQFTNLAIAAVPEPGTYVLLLSGLAVLGVVARRRPA